ncbi:rhomboid family intramembrane serine protease [Thioalkalivibrio thiocyanodenitrificans]|uniref:rhomboid family intramembrane serine protease n=1 Tax=Thioalkalivibrio thiocyanodenitrificans TaxID=243063 RepID=UPI00038045BB|nr:rhomboid family intramembrane serine protease [Thioalkalivibrio thiocyanodenitrificans]
MLLIPLQANLSLLRIPLITYAVIGLCVALYVVQWDRQHAIEHESEAFCGREATRHDTDSIVGRFLGAEYACSFVLAALHNLPSKEWAIRLVVEEFHEYHTEFDRANVEKAVSQIYWQFARDAPRSLDAAIMYDPKVPNPFRMVTSALAHADLWHLIGNLIFFFAFAGSIEIALDSRKRYITVLLALALVTSLAYSLTMIGSPDRIPSLGLSGVVMGMIGLFAYLMPWARIRTFVWILFYVNVLLVPAWMLAFWFIGWDIWNAMRLEGATDIDYSAHISGGVGGYLIGLFCFRTRKEEIAPLVADEIEHRRAESADKLGILDSARVSTERIEIQEWHHKQEQALERLLERVYGLATVDQAAAATALLIDELPSLGENVERQAMIMERMLQWPPNRTTLDFARIYTHRLITRGNKYEALMVCEQALRHSPMFRLSDAFEAVMLAEFADEVGKQDLALALVRDFEERYDGGGDHVRAGFLEARLAWEYLGDRDRANERLKALLAHREHALHSKVMGLAMSLKSTR